MTVSAAKSEARGVLRFDRYRLLQGGLLTLRAGPALILLLLIVVVSLTTPVFFTTRNIGNVFSQTSVIAVVPMMLVIMLTVLMFQLQRFSSMFLVLSVAPMGVIGVVVFGLPRFGP